MAIRRQEVIDMPTDPPNCLQAGTIRFIEYASGSGTSDIMVNIGGLGKLEHPCPH